MTLVPIQDFIDPNADSEAIAGLPFVHTQTIKKVKTKYQDTLRPYEKCEIFDEWLTYLYYGVPLYSPRAEGVTSEWLPVCFLLKPDKIRIFKVYPMDTGAFHGQPEGRGDEMTAFFEELNLPPKEAVKLYELSCDCENIRRYVIQFFGDNKSYFDGKCKDVIETSPDAPPKDNPVLQCLHRMLMAHLERLDDRCKLVEVLTKGCYRLNDVLQMVIWPNEQLSEFRALGYDFGALPIEYDSSCAFDQASFIEMIYQAAKVYLNIEAA